MDKKNRWIVLILILLGLCLLVVCVVGVFLWRGANSLAEGLVPYQGTLEAMVTSLPENLVPLDESTPAPQNPNGLVTLGASPVIYLAGRTDITIPALGQETDNPLFACRDGGIIQETYPPGYRIASGAQFTFSAVGLINYYGGDIAEGFPPEGAPDGSEALIDSFGAISGYVGPAGALAGVFLDDQVPNGNPPSNLDFSATGSGTDFTRLEPGLGQVFFIGDGKTTSGQPQTFIAPTGATRLYIGLVDGAGFYGAPGCYADNTGSYQFEVQSSQPFESIP